VLINTSLHENKQRTQLHWKRRSFLRQSLSHDWSHCPHLPDNSPKPFMTSYQTISRKHQVIAFERPSLSSDLISEIVSFNSGYKSRWNGHFKWSGATWPLSEQRGVSRHSVVEQIEQKTVTYAGHVMERFASFTWSRGVTLRFQFIPSVKAEDLVDSLFDPRLFQNTII